MPTLIQNVALRHPSWIPDSPGSGLMRQTATVDVAGRATEAVHDVACALAAALPWGEYGRTVFPWGHPFGLEVGQIPVGAVLLRAGVEAVESYTYGSGPDSTRLTIDILMQPGTDRVFLETVYERQVEVEEALEAMRATTVECGPSRGGVRPWSDGWSDGFGPFFDAERGL